MAEDRIDNYVDRTGFNSDTEFVLGQLNTIYEAFKKLDNIKISLGKSTGLAEAIPLMKQANTELNTVIDSQNKLAEASKKAADTARLESGSVKELREALAKNKQALSEVNESIADLNASRKKGLIDQQTYIEKSGELLQAQKALQVSGNDLAKALKNIEKESQAAEGSLDELRAKLNLATQAFDKLSAEEKKTAQGQELKKKVNDLLEAVSKEEQATGRFQRNVGNYANSLSGAFSKIGEEISKLQAKQSALQQQQARNPIGFKQGGGEDDLNKTTNALNQLIQAQQIGFKVGANQTQQVRQLEQAYLAFATSGTQSIEFLEAFKNEVGKVKDDVNDLRESIKLASSDTRSLDVLIGGAQAIAGGFGVAQGAAALFGNENEDLQKTLVKLNGVMTILNGLQAIQNELKKKDNILTIIQTNLQKGYAAVIGTSTGALKVFRTALAATGIGVFLVAIGALIFAFDKIKAAMGGISKEQQKIIDQAEKRVEQEDMNKELLDAQEESLKRIGYTEEQITKEKIKQLEKNKQAKLDLLETRRLTLQSQREAQLRSFTIVKGILDIITLPVTAISKVLGALTGKKLPTIGDIVGKELFDPAKVDKEFKELEDKIKLETTQIQGEIDGLLNQQDEKRKQAREKANKELEKKLKEQKEIEERNRKAQFEIEKIDIESRLRFLQKAIDDESELEKAREQGISGAKLKQLEKQVNNERLAALQSFIIDKVELINKTADFEKNKAGLTADEIKAIEKKKQDEINEVFLDAAIKRLEIIESISKNDLPALKTLAQSFSDAINAGISDANQEMLKGFDTEKELIQRKKDLYKQLYTELSGLAFDFFTNNIDREKNAIQEQIDLLERKKAKEIEAINATATSAEDKAARITIAEKRAQAQREILEQRQRQLDQQRARFEKAETITNIISETALAVIRALGSKPFTPANIALAALTGAIGAAQLARAIAAPIPKFRTGKNLSMFQSNDNYEGPALVGDGGKHEVHISGGKATLTPNTPTLTHVKKNDIILPDVNMLTDRVIARSLSKNLSVNLNGELEQRSMNELKNEVRSMRKELVKTIKEKREIHIKTPSARNLLFKDGNRWSEYLNDNLQF